MNQVAESSVTIRDLEKTFVENPKLGHDQLRQFKSDRHADFLREAIEVLEEGPSNSFSQVLLQICREDSKNLQSLLFTADLLSMDEASRLLRVASNFDPAQQMHLVANARAEFERAGAGFSAKDQTRLLDLLSKTVDRDKFGSILASLVDHPDATRRSKVALMSHQLGGALPKRSELLKDADPRVRANAVESFWGMRDVSTVQFFKDASFDPDHRVVANALYGLHLAGDLAAVRGILRLIRDPDPSRQHSAIWAIGKTGDPRFQAVVQQNLGLKTGKLKAAILDAGRKIKRRVEQIRSLPELKLDLVHFERLDKGRVRCSMILSDADGKPLPHDALRATELILHDGDLRIDQFYFEARGDCQPLHMALVVPLRGAQAIAQVVEQVLGEKRDEDVCSILRYRASPDSEAVADAALADTMNSTVELAARSFPLEAERRHLLLLIDPGVATSWMVPEAWPELLETHRVTMHVICCRDLEEEALSQWRKLCVVRKGMFAFVPRLEALPAALRSIVKGSPASFYFSYQLARLHGAAGPPESIAIEVYTDAGYAHLMADGGGAPVARIN